MSITLPEPASDPSVQPAIPMDGSATSEIEVFEDAVPGSGTLETVAAAQDDVVLSADDPADSTAAGETADTVVVEEDVTGNSARMCGVCLENEGKYKCTRCFLPYCSLSCSTIHKATHPALPSTLPPTLPPKPTFNTLPPEPSPTPRAGTLAASKARNPFEPLETSTELRALFKIYPNLKAQLEDIHEATLRPIDDEFNSPESTRTNKSHNSKFGNGKRNGGRNGRGQQRNGFDSSRKKKNESWTHDRGMENGVRALKYARSMGGEEGEGVREFSRAVLRILERETEETEKEKEKVKGETLEEMLRKQIEDENRRVVEGLLHGEMMG